MKVWYTSYGSNLLRDRFLCYILGGKVEGMKNPEIGCSNKTLPLKTETYLLDANYKFIEKANKWDDMGVAFISLTKPIKEKVIVTSYLIEEEQFIEIMLQENKLKKNDLDTTALLSQETKELFPGGWYSTLIYLGKKDGYDNYSFTCDEERFMKKGETPSLPYLKTIIKGAYSSEIFTKKQIAEHYFMNDQVNAVYTITDLLNLLR